MLSLPLLALAITGANTQFLLTKRQGSGYGRSLEYTAYLATVCTPFDSAGEPDWNAPCNALSSIQTECIFGPGTRNDLILNREETEDDPFQFASGSRAEDTPPMMSDEDQRACICQSQHNDMMRGCQACRKAHGGVEGEHYFGGSFVNDVFDGYCDAEASVSQGYLEVIVAFATESGSAVVSTPSAAATYSDPIGNVSTHVSLYYTPAVTGTAAYVPGFPEPASSGGSVEWTGVSTSNGLIVPTAAGGEDSHLDADATESTDGGAMQTGMAIPGMLGAVGLAALAAAL